MVALLLAACEPSSPTEGGTGGAGGGTGGAGGTGAGVTYTKDVRPIFMAKCSPCHAGMSLGMQDIATTYEDVLKPIHSVDSFGCWDDVEMTIPKKVGECALILILNGRMPQNAGCASTPPLQPSMCLSDQQKATLDSWIKAGMPR